MSDVTRRSPYDYGFDPDGASTAARLSRLVGRGQRVLELGCGYGVITRQLAGVQECIVTGVEKDAESAASARPWLDKLIVGDLEGTSWADGIQTPFQVILAADVIEHLRNPLDLLCQLHGLLEQGGQLILSVPNVGHAGVIAELLCGNFDYTPTGILDETHLRFFTWRSLERLLNAARFEVIHRETVEAFGSHDQFYEYWVKLPGPLRDMLDRHPTACVFQYVLVARSMESPAPLKSGDDEALQAWLAEPR
jgi:2-polyprenyl-3-methyl-5-hydroxy-6-metoxy-1,4-benzoquinol methylase